MNISSIDELAKRKKCVIYNDLSHITPSYLTASTNVHRLDEVSFHKRNIFLLSLYFEKIIICTDNIAAFTRFTSKDIVSQVVMSSWFNKLLQSGIIVLCGWGTLFNKDMMYNQIEYSRKYRPELKEKKYLDHLKFIATSSDIIVREPSSGEKNHVFFLRDKLRYLDGVYETDEMELLSEIITGTQEEFGYVGTMEIFPWVDDLFLNDSNKMKAFYHSYFQSWQEYCNEYYSPAITVDSYRNNLPARFFSIEPKGHQVVSSLYSPDFFLRFIIARIGERKTRKILGVKPERLISIRNGDWKVFLEKYHECLHAASAVSWILQSASNSNFLSNSESIDYVVDELFIILDGSTDLAAIGGLLDTVIGLVTGASFLNPVIRVFKDKINSRLKGTVDSFAFKEFEPFLRKLSVMLSDSSAIQSV